MAAHTLPGLGLTGGFLDGQDNWGDGMNANVALLTIATQTSVISAVADVPPTPADGDMYLMTAGANANRIAAWDDTAEAWTYTQPKQGWRLFNQDTGTYLSFIDGTWTESAGGSGVPDGGTTGQVLAKLSDDDGDADWVDPEAASLPAGGEVGQVLTKTAGGAEWDDVSGVPEGGGTGQVLRKASNAPGDVEWADPASATDIVWAVVKTIDGALLAGNGCAVAKVTISQFAVTFTAPRADTNYGILFGGAATPVGVQPYIVKGSKTVNGFSVICMDVNGQQADVGELVFQLAGTGVQGGDSGGTELPPGGDTGQVLTKASGNDNDFVWADPPEPEAPIESIIIAASDEATALTAGTSIVNFRMPYAFQVLDVRASVSVVSGAGAVVVDLNEGGVSILGTKLSIDAGEKSSKTAAAAVTITDPNLADDAEMTIDIDSAGADAKGLKITLIGRKL